PDGATPDAAGDVGGPPPQAAASRAAVPSRARSRRGIIAGRVAEVGRRRRGARMRRRAPTPAGRPETVPGDPLTRFQKLAALTLGTSILLVTIGVIVRATDSGLGCPDWPLCHGQLIPALDDPKAWIEWVHRTVAAFIGLEILGLALLAVLDHRDRPSLLWPSFLA